MKSRLLADWIANLLEERPLRANSLIITIYGDAIAPHGGSVWLGSFIRLVEPLGLNARMVRTSVFRLVRDQWLTANPVGRRSFYSLTADGIRRFEHAYRRIYEEHNPTWDGSWQIVLTSGSTLTTAQRDALRRELLWEGFGIVAPGVLAHPSADSAPLIDILQGNAAFDKVVVLQAQTLGPFASGPLHELVRNCWNLDHIAAEYQRFTDRFRPVLRTLKTVTNADPEQCFAVRTLLIHEFRRVLLRDPLLPQQLLPADWPGHAARQMCRDIYTLSQGPAEEHLLATLETAAGPLPPAAPYFYARFGGIRGARP
ncbi:MAG: phenylacetic acid degradation operon negative regulatory protein PaaX [Sterolibacteriaceae bacterium MAG5]|nr:phenylacetic acid degradation operon negative regulatory protein PaaX [Candidatus Nitricoxidireducens bremensis]